jgi:hypothetical protein
MDSGGTRSGGKAWTKSDLVNHLARVRGYRRYLEIHVPSTGFQFGAVDRSLLHCERLTYSCPEEWSDGCPVDFRVAGFDISEAAETLKARGPRYDIILVDPWHTYEASLRDLRLAYELLTPNGTLVVHDCLPPTEKIAGPEFIPGEWCGVTYKAFIDFVLENDLDYCTVSTDYGCGIVRKPRKFWARPVFGRLRNPADAEKLRHAWEAVSDDYAAAFGLLHADEGLIAKVVTVDEFLAVESRGGWWRSLGFGREIRSN